MPWIKIEGCGECPHVDFNNYANDGIAMREPDVCTIRCIHPEQESFDYRTVKIRSVDYSIYFNCPLKNQESEEEDYD